MPGIFLTGIGARNSSAYPGSTTVSPSGFVKSEAIFAMILPGPTPIEQFSPSFVSMVFLISVDISRAAEKASQPAYIEIGFIDAYLLEGESIRAQDGHDIG